GPSQNVIVWTNVAKFLINRVPALVLNCRLTVWTVPSPTNTHDRANGMMLLLALTSTRFRIPVLSAVPSASATSQLPAVLNRVPEAAIRSFCPVGTVTVYARFVPSTRTNVALVVE